VASGRVAQQLPDTRVACASRERDGSGPRDRVSAGEPRLFELSTDSPQVGARLRQRSCGACEWCCDQRKPGDMRRTADMGIRAAMTSHSTISCEVQLHQSWAGLSPRFAQVRRALARLPREEAAHEDGGHSTHSCIFLAPATRAPGCAQYISLPHGIDGSNITTAFIKRHRCPTTTTVPRSYCNCPSGSSRKGAPAGGTYSS